MFQRQHLFLKQFLQKFKQKQLFLLIRFYQSWRLRIVIENKYFIFYIAYNKPIKIINLEMQARPQQLLVENPYEIFYQSLNICAGQNSGYDDAEQISQQLGFLHNTLGTVIRDFISVLKYSFPMKQRKRRKVDELSLIIGPNDILSKSSSRQQNIVEENDSKNCQNSSINGFDKYCFVPVEIQKPIEIQEQIEKEIKKKEKQVEEVSQRLNEIREQISQEKQNAVCKIPLNCIQQHQKINENREEIQKYELNRHKLDQFITKVQPFKASSYQFNNLISNTNEKQSDNCPPKLKIGSINKQKSQRNNSQKAGDKMPLSLPIVIDLQDSA